MNSFRFDSSCVAIMLPSQYEGSHRQYLNKGPGMRVDISYCQETSACPDFSPGIVFRSLFWSDHFLAEILCAHSIRNCKDGYCLTLSWKPHEIQTVVEWFVAKSYERHKSLCWQQSANQAILKIPVTVEDSVSTVVFSLHCPLKSSGEL